MYAYKLCFPWEYACLLGSPLAWAGRGATEGGHKGGTKTAAHPLSDIQALQMPAGEKGLLCSSSRHAGQ